MSATTRLRFSKMHGAGNDFVILDRRGDPAPLSAALAARLADRHFGVGCDQVITIEPALSADSVASYGIRNADGSASRQCGNGARCVAAWLAREGVTDSKEFRLDSPAGVVDARLLDDGRVTIGMGVPDFSADAIGLRDGDQADPVALDVPGERLHFGAVSMGNPHAVIEVADVAAAEVARVGSMLQQHPAFLHGCNVGFAQVLAPDRIRLRVNERGVGETLACGSGACAAVAVLARRGRVGTRVAVDLPGGTLDIAWDGPGTTLAMTGPAQFVFEGEFIA